MATESKIRSPLLEALADRIGREEEGKRWLALRRGRPRGHGFFQRVRDIFLSALALVLLMPVFLVVALLVKLSSRGPVFFLSDVVGKDRKVFTWSKFRTMTVVPQSQDAEQRRTRFQAYVDGRDFEDEAKCAAKVIDHSRVTGIGRILRKFSIDELPQLWNVLKGEMSLVGPRPCLPYEAEFFTDWRAKRFEVKPGLTGVWQVFGRGRADFHEGAAMDVFYVFRRSFWFDLYIIFKTVGVVLSGKGAE